MQKYNMFHDICDLQVRDRWNTTSHEHLIKSTKILN